MDKTSLLADTEKLDSNPFSADSADDFGAANPFSDASVRTARATASDDQANPFDSAQLPTTGRASAYSNNPYGSIEGPKPGKDREMVEKEKPDSTYRGSNSLEESSSASREESLLRRENKLLTRERALEEKERNLRQRGGAGEANWPSKCYPLLYHDIGAEIPSENQNFIRKFYANLLFTWLCLVWNWLVIMVIWATDSDDNSSSEALWSSIFVVLGVPGAWRFWYRSVFYGVKDKKAGQWVFFFINFLCHIVFAILMGVGVPNVAGGGLFVMIKMFANNHNAAGFFSLVDVIIWGLNLLISVYLIKQAHNVWKTMGMKTQTKKEAAKAALEQANDV